MGEARTSARRHQEPAEQGQVVVLFALLLPMLLALGAIVFGLGNWFVHAKHLQTKVDAAAFAGGAVWGFPCGADVDAEIEAQARLYFGSHTSDDLSSVTSPHNPQVGGISGDRIYLSLNQAQWWGGSFPASDFSDPAGPVCESKILDVKATEQDVSPLWKLIPLFPDIKRKARVQIEEVDGLTGLLPIAVRLPQPLSAAAIVYDEDTGNILDAELFRQVCLDPDDLSDCIYGAPPGVGQWTTAPDPGDPEGSWASFPVATATGVVVATSVRPACGAGTPPAEPPCMNVADWVGDPIDEFCRQASGTVRCFDADGAGSSQTVNSGLHFIHGYPLGDVGGGPPAVRGAWLETVDCPANGYFNSSDACHVKLTVAVDIGSKEEDVPGDPVELVQTRTSDHVEVRYCLVRTGQIGPEVCDPDLGSTQFGGDQDLEECSGGPGEVTCSTVFSTDPEIVAASRENAFAIQVRLRRTSVDGVPGCDNDPISDYWNNCRWFFTGDPADVSRDTPPTGQQVLDAPIQRSFMGDIERTTPIKWLRLTADPDCDPVTGWIPDPDSASLPVGTTPCYVVDLGTAGGLARDQDEPPIAFNLGDNSSQRAYVDCDPNIQPIKAQIQQGCQWPSYAANKFDTTPYCPDPGGFFTLPKPAPFDSWPPFRCVITQTGNPSVGQITHGFNLRLFGKEASPMCPGDDMTQPVPGRNYWHRHNNDYKDETFAWDGDGTPSMKKGNTLPEGDPRLVTLFFTTYDSFTDTGNAVYPIVGFGNFYVTGYGEVNAGVWKGGGPEDPCDEGNGLEVGAGNDPPPNIDMSRNTGWVWGHFVKDVTPAPFTTGGSGVLCNPEASFQPCVAVLVE
jgi:Putative Flp pilus-assembly TadE/G-like